MRRAHFAVLLSLLLATPSFALGHLKRFSTVDEYCGRLQQNLSSSSPFVFSGPDPWARVDELPAAMPSEAMAFVYAAGPDIRWVFLRIVDTDEGWAEDVDYFFRQDGTIVKRVRQVRSSAAHTILEVTTYYDKGRILKERMHHHALLPGHQDLSVFSDPEAPVFWSVEDLPFPEIPDLWRRLA